MSQSGQGLRIWPNPLFSVLSSMEYRGRIQRKTLCIGLYAEVVYSPYTLTLCPLQSRLQHIYHGQPYDRVDLKGAQA
jgi:hypothetical protein